MSKAFKSCKLTNNKGVIKMKDVIELLKSMGAINIDFDESENGEYSSTLSFRFNDERAYLSAEWFNTQEAGISGCVEPIKTKSENKKG